MDDISLMLAQGAGTVKLRVMGSESAPAEAADDKGTGEGVEREEGGRAEDVVPRHAPGGGLTL